MRTMGLHFTLLLTLIFVGQSVFAASVPCMTMDASSNIAMDSAHAGHSMSTDSGSDTSDNECCGEGYCSVSGCVSPVGLADNAVFHGDDTPVRQRLAMVISSPNHLSTPDIRPPIVS